jgi:preprotein translocase subunit SecE
MSILKIEDNQKWINAFLAIISVITGYVTIRFLLTMGEWFDLEAKIGNYPLMTQGFGILIGVSTFIGIYKRKAAADHLQNVYGELVKVVWPDKDTIMKITLALMVGLSIVAGFFVLIDVISQKGLDFLYLL